MLPSYNTPATEIDKLIGSTTDIDFGRRMWTINYIGLYSQYAAVGLVRGMAAVSVNFCVYIYDGSPNLCANTTNIMYLFWSFKIFFGVITDLYRPFGMRRKPYIILGWILALFALFYLSLFADKINTIHWLTVNFVLQAFIVLADVPADGYMVELSQLENYERRGQIMATAQMISHTFSILAGCIQMIFLNGSSTNNLDCAHSWLECWSWGLNIRQYYLLMAAIVLLLFAPILFLKEIESADIPVRNLRQFWNELWSTFQSPTTCYLIIYVIGIVSFGHLANKAAVYTQSGFDQITSYGALVLGIFLFKRYLINRNWRLTGLLSTAFTSLLGSFWLLVFYDVYGLRNAWFTIFIDLDQSFAHGLSQILYTMAVIELAKPGQEATTYELLIGIANAAKSVSSVVSMQLLDLFSGNGCPEEHCPRNTVALKSAASFELSDGPLKYSNYTISILLVSMASTLIFIRYLPENKLQCHIWNTHTKDFSVTAKFLLGCFSVFLALSMVSYGILSSILVMNKHTSCWMILGGSGCLIAQKTK